MLVLLLMEKAVSALRRGPDLAWDSIHSASNLLMYHDVVSAISFACPDHLLANEVRGAVSSFPLPLYLSKG